MTDSEAPEAATQQVRAIPVLPVTGLNGFLCCKRVRSVQSAKEKCLEKYLSSMLPGADSRDTLTKIM